MTKIQLLLLSVCLFSVNIFASDSLSVTGKTMASLFDATGPVITYTTIIRSSCLTNKTFLATITDVDGVNTTAGTRPRVYYKRSTDLNEWNNNLPATAGWKYAEATNTSSPFSFNFDYSLLWGGSGISVGQIIEYFVVAQDLVATPNISINGGTFSVTPASVNLTATAFPVSGPNSHTVVNALGTYLTVGAFGDFGTFTPAGGLFNIINNVGLSGNTTIEILDPVLTENNSQPLNQLYNSGCSAGAVTLIIKPAAGVTATITGTRANEPVMRIFSSDVTIDGSNNGTTSRNLTIQNTNATNPNVIYLCSSGSMPISNTTLKNTICKNGLNGSGTVVVSDAAIIGGPGYFNNITIQNNSIQRGLIGLQCVAAVSPGNGSVLITGNDFNAISPNQTGSVGIYTEGIDGATISNNNIGNFDPSFAGAKYGIWMTGNTINTTVSGNTITGITAAATSSVYGIAVTASASSGIVIQKNNISNIKNTHVAGYGAYGIGLSSSLTASNITVANNFIYDIAGAGSSTVPLVRNGHGIYIGSGAGYKIYHNSVNLNTSQSGGVGITAALMINGSATAASLDVRNNIFANTQTGGAPAATRYAVYSTNTNAVFSAIDYNDYYSAGTNLGFITSDRVTLADIQAGFGSNISSLNVLPNFLSATNLHLISGSNCSLVGAGTPIAAVTDDIDNQLRDPVSPDMGADEFSGTLASPFVCQTTSVAATGTTYIDGSCNRIARVIPSGADPVGGSIRVCVTYDAIPLFFNGEPYVQRHYDLEPTVSNETTTSATVTLYFTDADFVNYNTLNSAVWPRLPTAANGGNTDPNRANVKITQFHGVATTSPSKPGFYPGTKVTIVPAPANVYWNGNYWAVTFNVAGFSGFYVHSNNFNTPLPVDINYFTGRKQGSSHLLNWKVTCNSTPGITVTIERSSDSRNFTGMHTLTADAARCQQPFDYTDAGPLPGMNYYRLKIADATGKVSYSTTVALVHALTGFDMISLAPNPVVGNQVNLQVASTQSSKMELAIFDMQGRLVNRQTTSLIAGFNSLPVQVNQLPAGTYTLRCRVAGEQIKIIRFVKQ